MRLCPFLGGREFRPASALMLAVVLAARWTSPAAAQDGRLLRLKSLRVLADDVVVDRPLQQPQAISIAPDGHMVIADTGNNRVLLLDRQGEVIREISGFGWQKDQFDRPVDVYAATGLDIFVADYNNRRVLRYDKDLNYLSAFATDDQLPPELQLGYASGVALSAHGELFVVDNENRRVLKIDSFGKPEFSFGSFSYGDGSLEDPQRIEISPEDIVYVSDAARGCIMVYDYYGNYVGRIGEGLLSRPSGLRWHRGGLWVADPDAGQVVLFGAEGEWVGRWNIVGEGVGALGAPADVDLVGSNLYVLERGNHRVQVFDWLDAPKHE